MQITICDICSAEIKRPPTRSVVNRRMTSAGDSEDVVELFDLCVGCELHTLRLAIKKTKLNTGYEFAICHSGIIEERIRANK